MAKAKIFGTDDDEEKLQSDAEELAQLNHDEGGELFRAIEELRSVSGAAVVVVKLSPAEEAGFCGAIPVAEFSVEELQNRYGAGNYKLRMRGPKGFIPGGGTLRVSSVGIKKKRDRDQDEDDSSKVDFSEFRMYMNIQAKRDAERQDRMDRWISLGLPIVGGIATALISRNSSSDMPAILAALKPAPGPSLGELSSVMVNMQQLSAPKQSESNVDTVLRVFEAAQNLRGDSENPKGSDTGWLDVLRDLIKVAPQALQPILAARMQAMQNQSQPPTIVQSAAPLAQASQPDNVDLTTASGADSISEGSNNVDMLKLAMPIIKLNLGKVVEWATKNRDPQIYADVLVDELPDNFGTFVPLPQVLEYLNAPNWFEVVCNIEPKLNPFRGWCNECRLSIIEIMKEFNSAPAEKETETPGEEQ